MVTVVSTLASLEVTLKSDPRYAEPGNAALVDLCRTLAEAIDAKIEPTTHQLAAYLSALKDLRRITETQPKGASRGNEDSGAAKPSLEAIRANVTPIGKARKRA